MLFAVLFFRTKLYWIIGTYDIAGRAECSSLLASCFTGTPYRPHCTQNAVSLVVRKYSRHKCCFSLEGQWLSRPEYLRSFPYSTIPLTLSFNFGYGQIQLLIVILPPSLPRDSHILVNFSAPTLPSCDVPRGAGIRLAWSASRMLSWRYSTGCARSTISQLSMGKSVLASHVIYGTAANSTVLVVMRDGGMFGVAFSLWEGCRNAACPMLSDTPL